MRTNRNMLGCGRINPAFFGCGRIYPAFFGVPELNISSTLCG